MRCIYTEELDMVHWQYQDAFKHHGYNLIHRANIFEVDLFIGV